MRSVAESPYLTPETSRQRDGLQSFAIRPGASPYLENHGHGLQRITDVDDRFAVRWATRLLSARETQITAFRLEGGAAAGAYSPISLQPIFVALPAIAFSGPS